jgi:hypothetical protein
MIVFGQTTLMPGHQGFLAFFFSDFGIAGVEGQFPKVVILYLTSDLLGVAPKFERKNKFLAHL